MNGSTRPTLDQIEWLKNNYKLYNNIHLAQQLNVPENRLTHWLRILGLRKRKEVRKVAVIKKKTPVKGNPEPEHKIKRPPSVYSNPSRDQHIERILNAGL